MSLPTPNLTKLEIRVARWLFKRIVRQGYTHEFRTISVLQLLFEAWRAEFTEDNINTQDEHLMYCVQQGLHRSK